MTDIEHMAEFARVIRLATELHNLRKAFELDTVSATRHVGDGHISLRVTRTQDDSGSLFELQDESGNWQPLDSAMFLEGDT